MNPVINDEMEESFKNKSELSNKRLMKSKREQKDREVKILCG